MLTDPAGLCTNYVRNEIQTSVVNPSFRISPLHPGKYPPARRPHIGLRIIVIDLTCPVRKFGLLSAPNLVAACKPVNQTKKHLALMIKKSQSQESRGHSRLPCVRRYAVCTQQDCGSKIAALKTARLKAAELD
jgi:hypothetical protein